MTDRQTRRAPEKGCNKYSNTFVSDHTYTKKGRACGWHASFIILASLRVRGQNRQHARTGTSYTTARVPPLIISQRGEIHMVLSNATINRRLVDRHSINFAAKIVYTLDANNSDDNRNGRT